MPKRVISAVIFLLLFIILTGCAPLELLRYFGVLRPSYTYEGYVIDFITKEPIPYATLKLNDRVINVDNKGYFKFDKVGSWEDWRDTHQIVHEAFAEGYGLLVDWSIDTEQINRVPLAPPRSAYGNVVYEGEREFRLELVGPNCGFKAVTYTDNKGEFYFIGIPLNEHLEIYIHEGDRTYLKTYIFELCKFYNHYVIIQDELVEE